MKAALIIPVFNHAGTIGGVLAGVRAAIEDQGEIGELIVIDDGCTDGSSEILRAAPGVTLLTHARNQGKGRALFTGFAHARMRGHTHAITLDADGQHDPGDIGKLLAAARDHPDDLVIGHRDLDAGGANVPLRSKKGRDAATFWLRVQTGQHIPDSQCGLRVYPLGHILRGGVPYRFWRFDFETEILARMAWAGLTIRSVAVTCIYFDGGRRVSHFRPVMDTLRGVRVNVFLVARRLAPLPFTRAVARRASPAFGKWWKGATWRDAVRDVLRTGSGNSEIATAFAVGIFVGLTPLYGLQTLLAIYFARRLHLNMLAAVVGSQISIPPLLPLWLFLSYGVGNFLLHGKWMAADFSSLSHTMIPAILLGNLLVALTVAAAGLFAARLLLGRFRREPVAR